MFPQAASDGNRQPVGSLRGLQRRLILFGLWLAGLIVALVGYSLWVGHDRALATAVRETDRLAGVLEQHAAQTAQVIDRALAATATLMDAPGAGVSPFQPAITSELARLLKNAPQMTGLTVYDVNGRAIQDSHPVAAWPSQTATAPQFDLAVAGGLTISAPLATGTDAHGLFAVGQPLQAPEGGNSTSRVASPLSGKIIATASQFLGYRYTWGGTSPGTGFDCSGFTYYVYRQAGQYIPRDLWGQVSAGPRIARADLQPGDLVFFQNTYTAGLSHSGIYIGGGRFIHAGSESSGVLISGLNESYWSSRFYAASRPGR